MFYPTPKKLFVLLDIKIKISAKSFVMISKCVIFDLICVKAPFGVLFSLNYSPTWSFLRNYVLSPEIMTSLGQFDSD